MNVPVLLLVGGVIVKSASPTNLAGTVKVPNVGAGIDAQGF